MRKLVLSLAVCGAALIGCNKSEPGGAVKVNPQGRMASTSGSFKISAPTGASNIKQGTAETYKIKLDRGSDFKEDVALSFMVPEGSKLKVEPSSTTIKASGDAMATVTVVADKDSPLGKHTIKIDGKPAHGDATSVNFDVEVVKP